MVKLLKFLFVACILSISLVIVSCSQEKEINVEYSASEGGSITGEVTQTAITSKKSVSFSSVTAVANEGYCFVAWSDGKTDATRQDTISESAKFTANFQKIQIVTVEYRADVGGVIEGNCVQSAEGKVNTTQVKAVANDGYKFKSWDDGLKSNVRNDESFENKIFTAIFLKVHSVEFACNSNEGDIVGRLSQKVNDGMSTMSVTAVPKIGYKFVGWSNGDSSQSLIVQPNGDMDIYAIFEKDNSTFPVISIHTDNNEEITSRKAYIHCSVSIENTEEAYSITNESAKIKGRGNTSWDSPKKPYKIKFDDSTDLFGNGEARTWTLIANHTDLSLIRNYLAYSVASVFETQQIASKTQFVDLFVNDEYLGVYLLCEQVEVHPERVDINVSADVDTGYLIELDARLGGSGFYLSNGEFYSIKSPDTDSALFTEEQRKFINDYLEQCYNAVCNGDYATIEELIDTKSFAQAYLVFELFNCVDVGYASFYMYKDAGGKLKCGPVWDFDRSLGVVGHTQGAQHYTSLWAKEDNVWFNNLLKHSEFEDLVSQELENSIELIKNKLSECYEYVYDNESAFLKNFDKWRILGTYVWPNSGETANLKTWQEQVEYTKEYLKKSLDYLIAVYIEN